MGLEVGVVVFFELIVVGVRVVVQEVVGLVVPVRDVRGRCPLFGTGWGGSFEGPKGW